MRKPARFVQLLRQNRLVTDTDKQTDRGPQLVPALAYSVVRVKTRG